MPPRITKRRASPPPKRVNVRMLAVYRDTRFESPAYYEKYENALAALQYDELAELPHSKGIRHYMTEDGEPIRRPLRFTAERSHSRHPQNIPQTTRSSGQDSDGANNEWVVAMDEALYGTPVIDGTPAIAQPNGADATKEPQSAADTVKAPVRDEPSVTVATQREDVDRAPVRGESPVTVVTDGTTPPRSPLKRVRELQKIKSPSKRVGILRKARTEDGFHNRPSIRLTLPDHLKAALVDDWENVTKNQQLVPLPHKVPAEKVLDDYLEFERPHREEDSASLDILEETVAGLREYFNKCLGRILLYRFERPQYIEMHELWETDEKYKSPLETYGAEHLCRLLVSLPELISQTNMDQQSVNRLRDELAKLTAWLGKNMVKYFVSDYETPNSEYSEKVRGV
ncbi:Esa1p-associated factor [Sporothrix stenoceras]|uniref:Esa1p-associated factor n=1 Tax=Sporothrix stenoceras TaxID=5173 RepID=A0ABR3Z9T7_9PEZI